MVALAISPFQIWYLGISTFPAVLFSVLYLGQVRLDLYARNIFDAYYQEGQSYPVLEDSCTDADLIYRSADGRCNDLSTPSMGMSGNRFGRHSNISIAQVLNGSETLLHPHPSKLSSLMKRKDGQFVESPNINLLAAAWIQFQTHDWFLHTTDEKAPAITIHSSNKDEICFDFQPTSRDADGHTCNEATHWWDASMIYGSNLEQQRRVRRLCEGKLIAGHRPLSLHIDPSTGLPLTAVTNNWWIGLSLMHRLFVAEHNYVAQSLAELHPEWKDEELFQHARLILAAILAKIHTVEWTPTILRNPTLSAGMNINWSGIGHVFNYTIEQFLSFGVPATAAPILEQVQKGVGGTRRFYGQPYAMTEEFVSVYRMHPLLPDDIQLRLIEDTSCDQNLTIALPELSLKKAEKQLDEFGIANWMNTFGYARAGHLTFNNYPDFLTNVTIRDGQSVNVAVMDIVRDRERLGLRYNELRRQLRLAPLTSLVDLNVTKSEERKLRRIYENNIELLDVFVGLMAEANWPNGYGFSTTAFQIFVIMASRRLETDRFYKEYFNADIYTPFGMDYVAKTDFKAILLRHIPSLATNLANVTQVFGPW